MDPWLIVFLVSTLLILIVVGLLIYYAHRLYTKSSKALQLVFYNPIHCGKNICERPITNLTVPTVNGDMYNSEIARYCSDLVMRVENGKSVNMDVDGLNRLGAMKIDDSNYFVVVWIDANGIMWVIYRGTSTNLREWADDIKYAEDSYMLRNKPNVQRSLAVAPNVKVHSGFYATYEIVADFVDNLVKKNTPRMVVVSGHSLGSATATLTGVHLASKGISSVVYNFGSPAVGNNEFVAEVDKVVKIYRHVNSCDVVPSLPAPVCPNFENPENPYIYTHCGEEYRFTLNYASLENNHSMGTYTEAFLSGLYKKV